MAPVPVGYKLLEEGEGIKSGYITYRHSFMDDSKTPKWQKCAGIFVGCIWTSDMLPMANPIVKSEEDKFRDIVKSAIEIFKANISWNYVPDFLFIELREKTRLDLDTLRKIRDIVQGG